MIGLVWSNPYYFTALSKSQCCSCAMMLRYYFYVPAKWSKPQKKPEPDNEMYSYMILCICPNLCDFAKPPPSSYLELLMLSTF
jgi:hypothetical protein